MTTHVDEDIPTASAPPDEGAERPVGTAADPTPEPDRGGDPSPATRSTPAWRDPSTVARWAGDAAAVALLVAALWYLENHDGGYAKFALIQVGVVGLVAAPVAWAEARRLSPRLAVLLTAWGVGGLASVAFAAERGAAVLPVLTLGLTPLVGLMVLRLWRRPWGAAALLALLVAVLGRYWYRSFLQWWGTILDARQPVWMPLSWRNPAGILMGGFGVLFTAMALTSRRVLRIGFALLGAGGLAGVWLSSSRGAVLVTALALVIATVGALRRSETNTRQVVVAGALTAVLTVGVVAALMSMIPPGGGTSPLASRQQGVAHNSLARVNHMQAALGMFLDDPLTGQGPGSYATRALDFTPADANLTASAHNEYVEILGEGGLLLGVPFLAAFGGFALMAGRRTWRSPSPSDGSEDDAPTTEIVRGRMIVGAAAMVTALGLHLAIDLDWNYPVIPFLLAAGAALLLDRRRADRASWWRGAAAVPVVLLLAAGVTAGTLEIRANTDQGELSASEFAASAVPWDHQTNRANAQALLARGEAELAEQVLERTLAWNPGTSRTRTLLQAVRFRSGEVTAAELAATLEDGFHRFDEHWYVAQELTTEGHYDLAEDVLDGLDQQLADYEAWGVSEQWGASRRARVHLVAERDGCVAAERLAADLLGGPGVEEGATVEDLLRGAGTDCA